jgi:hypothetical protein
MKKIAILFLLALPVSVHAQSPTVADRLSALEQEMVAARSERAQVNATLTDLVQKVGALSAKVDQLTPSPAVMSMSMPVGACANGSCSTSASSSMYISTGMDTSSGSGTGPIRRLLRRIFSGKGAGGCGG